LGNLTSITLKEIKELVRDPKILFGVVLMPLLLFPVMGSAIQVSTQSVERAIVTSTFAVYTDDSGVVTSTMLDYLKTNRTVSVIQADSLDQALLQFQGTTSGAMIYIPSGFSDNVTTGVKGKMIIYGNIKNMNIAETQSTNVVGTLVNIYSYYYSIARIENLLQAAGEVASPDAIRTPITIDYQSIIKGNVLNISPDAIISVVMNQSIMLPIMIMVMVMFAIQMAATSIALEKEQKTLETLMTLPVGRLTILSGKLAGSIVIAVAGAISYMIGFSYYMGSAMSFTQLSTVNLGGAGIGIQPVGYVLLGINIFVTLVSALAMAISLAVFADNVRSAQSLTGILIVPIIIPAIILMFSDIDMLPQTFQWILLAIPYTHSILASKAAFMGDYWIVLRSIAYISIFTIVVLYIAAKIFSTERIITARFTSRNLSDLFKKRR
jgi:ABC-2 type transport system permease protein